MDVSQHSGASMAEGYHSTLTENSYCFVFNALPGGPFLADFLENEIVGFDENVALVLLCDLQQYVMLE